MKKVLFSSFIALLVLFSLAQAKMVVVNSQNWMDVYSGLLYAKEHGMDGYFLNTPNPEGLLNILPKGQDILLIQSSKPYVKSLQSLLMSKGYKVELKEVTDSGLDLMGDQKTVYVVEKDMPTAALIVAPLAKESNSWVVFVDTDNLANVIPALNGKNVILVGYFKRSVKSALDKIANEEIIDPSKFTLSLKIADRFLSLRQTSQVLVSDGKYIEEEIFSGYSPLIVVGNNLLPDDTLEWMLDHNVKTCVLIGTQMTYIGEQIRTKSNKQIAVFIKYGQALPGTPIYALTMMPIPSSQIKLEVVSVIYDPSQKKLYVTFKNSGNAGLFELTNLRVLYNGNEIASVGEKEPTFIGAGENYVSSYQINISPEMLAKNLTVQFFTSYGETPTTMDSYLTNMGKFGPPLTTPLQVKTINDQSELKVVEVTYYKLYSRIGVKVKNTGNVPAYFIVKLPNVIIQGVPTSLSSHVTRVLPGDEREVFIVAKMDPIDVKENSEIDVILDYGENREMLIKSIEETYTMKVESGIMTILIVAGAVAAVIIGVVAFYTLKKKKAKKRKGKKKKKKKKAKKKKKSSKKKKKKKRKTRKRRK